jgi:hypothetical protein
MFIRPRPNRKHRVSKTVIREFTSYNSTCRRASSAEPESGAFFHLTEGGENTHTHTHSPHL